MWLMRSGWQFLKRPKMQHNKISLSQLREEQLLKMANRNTLVRFVVLMNEYHATADRYYPSVAVRDEYQGRLRKEIIRLSKIISRGYGSMAKSWMANRQTWIDAIDTIHINR